MYSVQKREMNALDYAVAELLANLTTVLTAVFADKRITGWDVSNGFNYTFLPTERDSGIVNVSIHPFGWPDESEIVCKFTRGRVVSGGFEFRESSGWEPFHGMVSANHLNLDSGGKDLTGFVSRFVYSPAPGQLNIKLAS